MLKVHLESVVFTNHCWGVAVAVPLSVTKVFNTARGVLNRGLVVVTMQQTFKVVKLVPVSGDFSGVVAVAVKLAVFEAVGGAVGVKLAIQQFNHTHSIERTLIRMVVSLSITNNTAINPLVITSEGVTQFGVNLHHGVIVHFAYVVASAHAHHIEIKPFEPLHHTTIKKEFNETHVRIQSFYLIFIDVVSNYPNRS